MKFIYTLILVLFISFSNAQTVLIDPAGNGGFETGTTFATNGWIEVNGVQFNKWFLGNQTPPVTGARCAYISDNAVGLSYNYTLTQSSVSYFYQDITFPAGESNITLSFNWKAMGQAGVDYLQVFLVPTSTVITAGTLLGSGQVGSSLTGQSTWQSGTITLPCTAAGTTQRLAFCWRNDAGGGTQPPAALDNISLISSSTPPTCSSLLGGGVINVSSLPFASGAGSTCGSGNDLKNTNTVSCGSINYVGGEDQVFIFTPTTSGLVTINLTSSGSWTGLMLYDGCPLTSGCGSITSGTCIKNIQSATGNKSMAACVTAGTTYYLVLDSWPAPNCNAYSNLTISAPAASDCLSNLGSGVTNVSSLPFASGAGTTCGKGDNLTSANTVTCGSTNYLTGEDEVFIFTPAASGQITISLTSSGTRTGLMLYKGCPISMLCSGGTPGTCIANSQSTSGNKTLNTCVTAGETYYLILDSWSTPSCNAYSNLTISAPFVPDCLSALGTGVTSIASLPFASGAGTTCGKGNDLTSTNTIVCGSTSYLGGEDEVFVFTPATSGMININLTSSGSWTGLMLYAGCPSTLSCGAGGTPGTCVMNSQSSSGNKSLSACVTAGVTYYIVIDSWPAPACNSYSNLTISAPVTLSCPSSMGTGVVSVSALPYSSSGRTTCGKVNDMTNANVATCGNNNYFTGEDEVFVFTPGSSGNITISITSTGSNTGLMLYEGCPYSSSCSASSTGTCVAFEQSFTGSKSICYNVIAGRTYYLIVDSWAFPICNPYSISISAPTLSTQGATCADALLISSLPYNKTGENTACLGNHYTNASTASCGSLYESGEDKVYKYVATGSECIGVTLSSASTSNIGFQVYYGCPDAAGTACIGSFGGATSGILTGTVVLPSAGTYYFIIDTWASPNSAAYNINITSFGNGPANDLPCAAEPLPLSVNVNGNNNCSGGVGEPAVPTCWTPGTLNTVWFSFIAPTSGRVIIRTSPGTLLNTQIAVFNGTCSSLAPVVNGCNDDAPACGSTSSLFSQLDLNLLIPGTTYYVAVDGFQNETGSFGIIVIDGLLTFPPSAGQDCPAPNPVCNRVISVGNPGYQAIGNICDFGVFAGNCLASGERGTVWYEINIATAGTLNFDVVPNDWSGAPSTTATDYDFAVWKTGGVGAETCATIASGATPTRCNYSGLGVTGLSPDGNAPAAYPGFDGAYEMEIPVLAGEKYLLVLSNFSNSTSGFTLSFSTTSPINYTSAPATVVWSGGVDTDWFKSANWGGCAIPTCTINAIISPSSSNQPVINAPGAVCKSLTINSNASLGINDNYTLAICGDYINSGTLTAAPTSTILFNNGSVVQNMNGNMIDDSRYGNLTINKTGGTVNLNQNLDMAGSFLTSNVTSVFNVNGKYIKLAGDFTNNAGNTTFSNVAGSTLEFNGAATQYYTNINNVLRLNNVTMMHTASGVILNNNMILGNLGVLTLTTGKIITGNFEVQVENIASAAATTGNDNSYVEGYLRRYLSGNADSYDFPVGHALKGFQRANVTFSSSTTIPNLLASFYPFVSIPYGPVSSECPSHDYSLRPALDNGYWKIDASANPGSGNYTMTLYNKNHTNSAGSDSWTVMKAPVISDPWILDGNCVPTSTADVVQRDLMSGFSVFTSAQSQVAAVPLDLLSFTATGKTNNISLKWVASPESINGSYEIQKSLTGENFVKIGEKEILTGNNISSYYFQDDEVDFNKIYYYRLKKFMGDQIKFSQIVRADLSGKTRDFIMEVFPNPYSESFTMFYSLENKAQVEITIYNAFGEPVKNICNEFKEPGQYQHKIERKELMIAPGVYTIKCNINAASYTYKIIALQ